VETSRLELLGESPHSGRAILASANEEDRSALDEAREFLLAELDDEARHPAEGILMAARRIGIRDRTLRRAPRALRRAGSWSVKMISAAGRDADNSEGGA
jgi:hypothetical protein